MLNFPVIHPELLSILGSAGHLSKILITDANYPHSTHPHPGADHVWANYMPGILDGPTALRVICEAVPIEAVHVMEPAREGMYAMENDPPVWADYKKVLADHADFTDELIPLQKPPFNELAQGHELALVMATGESAAYANILLTIGVVKPE